MGKFIEEFYYGNLSAGSQYETEQDGTKGNGGTDKNGRTAYKRIER